METITNAPRKHLFKQNVQLRQRQKNLAKKNPKTSYIGSSSRRSYICNTNIDTTKQSREPQVIKKPTSGVILIRNRSRFCFQIIFYTTKTSSAMKLQTHDWIIQQLNRVCPERSKHCLRCLQTGWTVHRICGQKLGLWKSNTNLLLACVKVIFSI